MEALSLSSSPGWPVRRPIQRIAVCMEPALRIQPRWRAAASKSDAAWLRPACCGEASVWAVKREETEIGALAQPATMVHAANATKKCRIPVITQWFPTVTD